MTLETDDLIRLTRDGAVATIWLNRPQKRNAMTYSMWVRLGELAVALGADPEVRVVVLRGSGEQFCAGADITELNIVRPPDERSFSQVNLDAEAALATLPKPTIAFISGDCIGGGCAMAIDCDMRIATSDARFGITPAKLGIVYPSASLERVTNLLGPSATKRLLFTGDLIDAEEARRVGLVDEVLDAASASGRLATLTGVLASRSLLTQAATKSMVAGVMTHGRVTDELRQRWIEVASRATDSAEGIAAFVDRRPAKFTWSGLDDD
jgi:enoyl-CoA hydratase/carnithine racemase